MNFYTRLLLLLIVAAVITTGCSKNADPVPPEEETVENDTITFPHVMAVSTKKGLARIFTNGRKFLILRTRGYLWQRLHYITLRTHSITWPLNS